MYLHQDKRILNEMISGAAAELQIDARIIEKDYYVTTVLKALNQRIENLVIKGGTSLSKCYDVL